MFTNKGRSPKKYDFMNKGLMIQNTKFQKEGLII